MIACPICGADTRVTETRKTGEGGARRRRRCVKLACAGRVTTVEVVVSGADRGAHELANGDAVLVSRGALARLRRAVDGLGGAL